MDGLESHNLTPFLKNIKCFSDYKQGPECFIALSTSSKINVH